MKRNTLARAAMALGLLAMFVVPSWLSRASSPRRRPRNWRRGRGLWTPFGGHGFDEARLDQRARRRSRTPTPRSTSSATC